MQAVSLQPSDAPATTDVTLRADGWGVRLSLALLAALALAAAPAVAQYSEPGPNESIEGDPTAPRSASWSFLGVIVVFFVGLGIVLTMAFRRRRNL